MPSIVPRPVQGRSLLGVLAMIVRAALWYWAVSWCWPYRIAPAGWLAIGGDGIQVGLVAGHWQSDSGAICPTGYRRSISTWLWRAGGGPPPGGLRVEVLPEYAPARRVSGAGVRRHSRDSCVGELSGFKVAHHAVRTHWPRCAPGGPYREYAAVTGLSPHPHTITDDMRRYHGLRKMRPIHQV